MDAAPAAANNGPSQQQQQPNQPMQLHPDDMPKHIDETNYMLPIMAKLARDPKVTRKDVIRAISDAMADGKFTATEAIEKLAQVPSNQDALKAFLRQKYTQLIQGAVHLNAAQAMLQQQRGG
jgi:hypothetical protein